MSGNRRFLFLIFGVKLDEVRMAMARMPGCVPSEMRPQGDETLPRASPMPPIAGSLIEAEPLANASQSPSSLIDFAKYMQPPSHFISLATHPKKTNLLCWNCSLGFSRVPRFIAFEGARIAGLDSDSATAPFDWTIGGNFCSWACAARYITDNYDDPKKWALLQNLAVVRAQCDGVRIRMVQCAPDKIKMRSYSGACGLSQQEYSDAVESMSVP